MVRFLPRQLTCFEIHIPIEDLNMAPSIWGPDARTFKPSRWLGTKSNTKPPDQSDPRTTLDSPAAEPSYPHRGNSPDVPPGGPGIWPNIMTFIDGPRRCVGYKLALMELKITLFVLVREFVFAPVPGERICKWNL